MTSPYRRHVERARIAPNKWARVRAVAADYGRDEGWHVFWRGALVAELTEPRFHDMFWTSYAFAPLATDPVIVAAMGEDAFWRSCEARLRTSFTSEGDRLFSRR